MSVEENIRIFGKSLDEALDDRDIRGVTVDANIGGQSYDVRIEGIPQMELEKTDKDGQTVNCRSTPWLGPAFDKVKEDLFTEGGDKMKVFQIIIVNTLDEEIISNDTVLAHSKDKALMKVDKPDVEDDEYQLVVNTLGTID